MIAVICKSSVKEENLQEFLTISARHRDLTLLYDEGCVFFEVGEPVGEEVTFLEMWESQDFLDAHAKAAATRKEVPAMNLLRYAKSLETLSLIR